MLFYIYLNCLALYSDVGTDMTASNFIAHPLTMKIKTVFYSILNREEQSPPVKMEPEHAHWLNLVYHTGSV